MSGKAEATLAGNVFLFPLLRVVFEGVERRRRCGEGADAGLLVWLIFLDAVASQS